MRQHKKRLTQTRYVVTLAAFLLFLSACLIVFYYSVNSAAEHYTEESLHTSVGHQAYQLQYILNNQFTALSYLADHISHTGDLLGEDSLSLLQSVEQQGDFQRVMICTPDGVGHTADGTETQIGDRDYFKQSMQGKNSISDPLSSSLNGEERVVLSVPIWSDGQVIGILGGSYDLRSISTMLFSDLYGGKGISFLISRNGTLIIPEGVVLEGSATHVKELCASIEFEYPDTEESLESNLKNGISGSCRFRYQGEEVYWIYEPLGIEDWNVCYIISRDDAQENYHFILQYETFFMIAFFGAVAGLLFVLLRFYLQDRRELLHLANTDPLTSLLNKESTQQAIEQWLERGEKTGVQVMLMLDMDGFKQINDTYGHGVGDHALQQAATLLKSIFRADDILGRVGGDEFMILMKNVSDLHAVERQMTRVCRCFQEITIPEAPGLVAGCSIGAAYHPQHGTNFTQLYRQADQALYQAKGCGRGTWVICQNTTEV